MAVLYAASNNQYYIIQRDAACSSHRYHFISHISDDRVRDNKMYSAVEMLDEALDSPDESAAESAPRAVISAGPAACGVITRLLMKKK